MVPFTVEQQLLFNEEYRFEVGTRVQLRRDRIQDWS